MSGTVTKDAFDRLCDNLHPATGEKLTPRTNGERRVGYDFTFSGPKSFSILVAMAPEEEREQLRAAFDASVEETMTRRPRPDMQCRVRKDGAYPRPPDRQHGLGGVPPLDRPAGGGTARPTCRSIPTSSLSTRRTTAIVGEPHQGRGSSATSSGTASITPRPFTSQLAGRLEAMGLVIDRRGGKEWEIAGIPQSMIDKFNKRSAEIEAEHRGGCEKILTTGRSTSTSWRRRPAARNRRS